MKKAAEPQSLKIKPQLAMERRLHDHHGDGRLAINSRAPRGMAKQLSESHPDRFHIPIYVAHRGWVGLWLDTPKVDWVEVKSILTGAYRMTAPKSLAAKLDSKD